MSISTYLEEAVLHQIFRRQQFSVEFIYVSLHTADPGRRGAGEFRGGGYKRQLVSFDGNLKNADALEFRDLTRSTITHAGLWDAPEGGHFLWGSSLGEEQAIGDGWNFQLPQGLISGPSIR